MTYTLIYFFLKKDIYYLKKRKKSVQVCAHLHTKSVQTDCQRDKGVENPHTFCTLSHTCTLGCCNALKISNHLKICTLAHFAHFFSRFLQGVLKKRATSSGPRRAKTSPAAPSRRCQAPPFLHRSFAVASLGGRFTGGNRAATGRSYGGGGTEAENFFLAIWEISCIFASTI